MTQYHFTVVLEPDREEPERHNARVPTLPGCLTYGESLEDALANGELVPAETRPTMATTVVTPDMDA